MPKVAGLADLVGDDVPAWELERLRPVDALLHAIPGPSPGPGGLLDPALRSQIRRTRRPTGSDRANLPRRPEPRQAFPVSSAAARS